jgi:NAD(P)-dependent dehydrogenase (short-subunit alcohol dehydrogenase family)
MTDRTALVTGVTSATGREVAARLVERGYRVAVSGRRPASEPDVAKLLDELPGTVRYYVADLTRESDVRALVEGVLADFGGLDRAFNNAGGTLDLAAPLTETDVTAWHRVLDLNLTAVMISLKHQMRAMRANGGAVVCTAGALGHSATANMAAYVAAKHAVIGLARAAALEGAEHGIRVNALSPGMSVRNEDESAHAGRQNAAARKVPLGRLGTAEEIAEVAVWLMSDAASFVTGHALVADGGWLAQI